MIEIDGSIGEGGGQMVRSSLALSMLTGKPFLLDNIRARRKNPGLQRQHLTAVLAAGEISGVGMIGASLHSSRLQFAPGPVQAGSYRFDIGTAGSASLVLQTVLLPLMLAEGHSELTLVGGTHNPLAPPYEFFALAYLPLLHRLGLHASVELVRRGFYPAGGGELRVAVSPATELCDFELLDRGDAMRHEARVIVAKLPEGIAGRELDTLKSKLGWKKESLKIEEDRTSRVPGNAVLVVLEYQHVTEVIVSFGERGKRAEQVAQEAAEDTLAYLDSTASVGPHLADQLLLPLGIAASRGHTCRFHTMPLTQHSLTHMEILQRFLDLQITTQESDDNSVVIELSPSVAGTAA
jgi:RNA 3'-terminal phosphate cyclase (ATP)